MQDGNVANVGETPQGAARPARFRPWRGFAMPVVTSARTVDAAAFSRLDEFPAAGGALPAAVSGPFVPHAFMTPAQERRSELMEEVRAENVDVETRLAEKEKSLEAREAALAAYRRETDAKAGELAALSEELERRRAALEEHEKEVASEKEDLDAEGRALDAIAQRFGEMKKGYWAENAPEIVEFALQLVEKIVMDRIVRDPSVLVKHIRAVIEEMKIDEPILVFLCPEDLDRLRRSDRPGVAGLMTDPRVKWLGDSRLGKGEVHVDTSQYRLDASITTALRNLREDLTAKRRLESETETETRN